jgi:hypothetical protein
MPRETEMAAPVKYNAWFATGPSTAALLITIKQRVRESIASNLQGGTQRLALAAGGTDVDPESAFHRERQQHSVLILVGVLVFAPALDQVSKVSIWKSTNVFVCHADKAEEKLVGDFVDPAKLIQVVGGEREDVLFVPTFRV